MKLNLKKSLVFFDLETTGINISADRIVELTYLKIEPNGTETVKTIRINPEMHIPEKASELHGIYDEDVIDSPTFAQIAKSLAFDIKGCDLAGYNSNRFDIPLLAEEFLRAEVDIDLKKCKFVDAMVIFYKMEQRTLSAAYQFYCGKDLKNAHTSEADTRATYEILLSQLDKYPNLENSVDFLSEFSAHTNNADFAGRIIYDEKKREIFNFGQYKGQVVADVFRQNQNYYAWMMSCDFPLYTKKVITEIKLREKLENVRN
ncbi:MAG: 3'-5' exonuclease [Prevotellaceae bacterium]|jgi:DNA polymerase-3 subunit epsilon|nr:3'-5' exonuclease [Prevotellaceae bacterium]